MGHQMRDDQKELVENAILDAVPPPEDIDDCVQLLKERKVFSQKKINAFGAEFRQVCEEALAARDAKNARNAMPLTPPPSSDISPRCSSADPVPGTPHDDEALRAAAASCSKNTREMVHLYRSSTRDFHFASTKHTTNTEFSYINEQRLNQLKLQHNDRFIQLGWIDSSIPSDGDHTAKETVFVLVSNDQALRNGMNVDILFGRRYKEDVEVQLQAVRRSMDLQSPPSPCDIQPDESCAGSVAEAAIPPTQAATVPTQAATVPTQAVMLSTQAAMLPTQAAKSPPPPPNYSVAFVPSQHAADFFKAVNFSGAPCGPG